MRSSETRWRTAEVFLANHRDVLGAACSFMYREAGNTGRLSVDYRISTRLLSKMKTSVTEEPVSVPN